MISTSNSSRVPQPQARTSEAPTEPEAPTTNTPLQNESSAGAAESGQALDSLLGDMSSYASRRLPNSRTSHPSAAQMGARVFGDNFSQTGSRQTFQFKRAGLDIDSMTGLPMPSLEQQAVASAKPEKQVFPRLNPAYGRTVHLDEERGFDIVRGINTLSAVLARNKVRQDFNKQKFHERGGLKRKRLKSERWRARFKKGFNKVTARVGELTRKGW